MRAKDVPRILKALEEGKLIPSDKWYKLPSVQSRMLATCDCREEWRLLMRATR